MNFSTVLYCAVRRRLITSWTSRTVAGPMLHKTVKISSSASVGLGGVAAIYEKLTSKIFVCQESSSDVTDITQGPSVLPDAVASCGADNGGGLLLNRSSPGVT